MSKTVIVTGGSGGIGAACARAFAKAGYNVVVGYLKNAERANEVVDDIKQQGGEAAAFCCDARSSAACKALVMFALGAYNRLDAVVCAAGAPLFALAQQITDEQQQEVFDINTFGTMNLCRAAIPAMLARGGAIVTVGSMWGETGAACESAYSASKGAVIAYTKALAKELAPSGITVNCVSPGFIDTAMNAALSGEAVAAVIEQTPLARAGSPDEVAAAALALATNPFITGQVLGVNGGLVI